MSKLTTFLDPLGRIILGTLVDESPTHISVQNPVILHTGTTAESKINVNLFPVFFREFLADWNIPTIFKYNKATITQETNADSALLKNIIDQYDSMWATRPDREEARKQVAQNQAAPIIAPTEKVEKLNLFEEVKA